MSPPRILLTILFLFISITFLKNVFDYQGKLRFYQEYKAEYEDQRKKNLTLKTEILKKTDPYEIEKTIRNKLNLAKESEVDIILPKPSPTPIIITPTIVPNWKQWVQAFFTQ